MFVDSHCHLDGARWNDRADVIARAREAGLQALVSIGNGEGPDDVDCAIKLAESSDESIQIFATIGIHPHEARLAEDRHYATMQSLAKHPKVIGWGEIGLDYHYDHSPRDVQKQVFSKQMELAREAKLPIIIHCRPSDNSENAWDDCLTMIRNEWASSGLGGILHCFTGYEHHARAALDMGFLISFAGNITYPKAQNIRDAAKIVPLDRLLIETDSPYLAPVPHRGKRNEPSYVVETARQIGTLRDLSVEEVGDRTTQNFYRLFKIENTVGKSVS